MTTAVDGEIQQQTPTNDVVFTPEFLVSYISTIITLNPGDVIATGTPDGVGFKRTPPRYLGPGDTVTVAIQGVASVTTPVVSG